MTNAPFSKILGGALILFMLFSLFSSTTQAQSNTLNVMTFNIRLPAPQDGFNYWPKRKELVASTIRYHEADLVGVQEAFRSQLDELMRMLPQYAWVGLCRTDGTRNPDPDNEFSAILYRTDRFELIRTETFWLAPNPSIVGAKGWDTAIPRIVTWARFKDKRTQKEFYHFNTHFDHVGKTARKESALLIKKQIATLAGDAPVVLTGDFNCIPVDPPYRILTNEEAPVLKDALYVSEMPHHGPVSTWTNGFQFPGVPDRRIDYIFINDKVSVHKHAILSDNWSGRLPSDHLPVIAEIEIK